MTRQNRRSRRAAESARTQSRQRDFPAPGGAAPDRECPHVPGPGSARGGETARPRSRAVTRRDSSRDSRPDRARAPGKRSQERARARPTARGPSVRALGPRPRLGVLSRTHRHRLPAPGRPIADHTNRRPGPAPFTAPLRVFPTRAVCGGVRRSAAPFPRRGLPHTKPLRVSGGGAAGPGRPGAAAHLLLAHLLANRHLGRLDLPALHCRRLGTGRRDSEPPRRQTNQESEARQWQRGFKREHGVLNENTERIATDEFSTHCCAACCVPNESFRTHDVILHSRTAP